jgi:1,4-alpha-glucan branching enzyme
MIEMAKQYDLLDSSNPRLLYEQSGDKIIAFERSNLLFVFNFHPSLSYTDYLFDVPPGKYEIILDSDALQYGGHGRIDSSRHHFTMPERDNNRTINNISLYLPTRTALILKQV